MPPEDLPTATYRLQLQPAFGFAQAAEAVPYLADLGVSHLHLSPILQAVPGSTHGYDVVDHGRLSSDLGGEEQWERLVATTTAAGLGIVVDVVPNHMAVPAPEWLNAPLWDVLCHGQQATHAEWFDIDWDAQDGRILLPLLGDGDDAIKPIFDPTGGPNGEAILRYFDHAFPLAPGSEGLFGRAQREAQHYRLANWREAARELNYRRFLNISSLIAIRVELDSVFEATHELLLAKVSAGEIAGLRIDHPDGLADPAGYLTRLAARTPGAWIVAEKILGRGEQLPRSWPVHGTTGYDALNAVSQAFLDPAGFGPLTEIYAREVGVTASFAEIAWEAKRAIATGPLAAESRRLARVAGVPQAEVAIADLLAAWAVYRSYVPPSGPPSPEDLRFVADAAARAGAWRPTERDHYREWAARVLSGEDEFAIRLQQTTGMVMGKGVEDTAFYRYHRLIALCEVGGDPAVWRTRVDAFHRYAARLAEEWPSTMTTLSTHDTKRSEDVRSRVLVLAEVPDAWAAAVHRWRSRVEAPDPNLGYLWWQTLVGAWPLSKERAARYLQKAAHEAKVRTSWAVPNPMFDQAVDDFCTAVFADSELLEDVASFVAAIEAAATAVSLGQKLVQLTMPGIPDLYQGSEQMLRSLVDPDNRDPLDLATLPALPARLPSSGAEDPRAIKLLLTSRVLRLRREHPEWFGPDAGYTPLQASGPHANHVLAFRRRGPITVATRYPHGLATLGGWTGDTALDLPPGVFTDVLTERTVTGRVILADLLDPFPVALLASSPRHHVR